MNSLLLVTYCCVTKTPELLFCSSVSHETLIQLMIRLIIWTLHLVSTGESNSMKMPSTADHRTHFLSGCWQDASIPQWMDPPPWLPECHHNMAAGFPPDRENSWERREGGRSHMPSILEPRIWHIIMTYHHHCSNFWSHRPVVVTWCGTQRHNPWRPMRSLLSIFSLLFLKPSF